MKFYIDRNNTQITLTHQRRLKQLEHFENMLKTPYGEWCKTFPDVSRKHIESQVRILKNYKKLYES